MKIVTVDFSGTLVENRKAVSSAIKDTCISFGIVFPYDIEYIKRCASQGNSLGIIDFLIKHDKDYKLFKETYERNILRYLNEIKIYEDFLEKIIEFSKSNNYKLIIVSGQPKILIELVLKDYLHYFYKIYGDIYLHKKPELLKSINPEIYITDSALEKKLIEEKSNIKVILVKN